MRQSPFELLILRSDGTVIAEHELDGKHYIAAEPSIEYKVKVVVHPDKLGSLPYTSQRMSLSIDGRAVNYTFILTAATASATFVGFRKDMDAYQAFMFEDPSDAGPANTIVRAESIGSIKMTVNETVQTTTLIVPNFPPAPDFVKADEGKKFWQQPSLQTGAGRIILAPKPTGMLLHKNVRPTPDATLEIFYHTTDMVAFLKTFHTKKEEEDNALTSRVIAPPVHVDLSEVASPVRAPAETVDLTRPAATGRGCAKVKREYQGGTGRAAKKPRATSKAAGGGGREVVDLT